MAHWQTMFVKLTFPKPDSVLVFKCLDAIQHHNKEEHNELLCKMAEIYIHNYRDLKSPRDMLVRFMRIMFDLEQKACYIMFDIPFIPSTTVVFDWETAMAETRQKVLDAARKLELNVAEVDRVLLKRQEYNRNTVVIWTSVCQQLLSSIVIFD